MIPKPKASRIASSNSQSESCLTDDKGGNIDTSEAIEHVEDIFTLSNDQNNMRKLNFRLRKNEVQVGLFTSIRTSTSESQNNVFPSINK